MSGDGALHGTRQVGQPFGEVRDWRRGDAEPVPGKTIFNLKVKTALSRHVQDVLSALGPTSSPAAWARVCRGRARRKVNSSRRVSAWFPSRASRRRYARTTMPRTPVKSCWPCPESNGDVGCARGPGWKSRPVSSSTTFPPPVQDQHLTFEGITARPQGLHQPELGGIEVHGRTYAPFELNVQRLVPFHAHGAPALLHGSRMDARSWRSLPVYRPPRIPRGHRRDLGPRIPRTDKIWCSTSCRRTASGRSIRYSDNHIMRELSRGGGEIWLNNDDAASAGIADNDWLECFNANGVFMGKCGGEPYLIPHGKNVHPSCAGTYRQRAARRFPARAARTTASPGLVGLADPDDRRYGQLSYFFNYYGPTGCQRDSSSSCGRCRGM